MSEDEKQELKKLIHEVLDERFGCSHIWHFDSPDTSAIKRCTKCNQIEFDFIYADFKGIKILTP